MFNLSQAKLYKEELLKFENLAENDYVRNILKNEREKLQKYIDSLDNVNVKKNISLSAIKIINYGWGQNEKYLELYITLNGIQNLNEDQISSVYCPKSIELIVKQLDGKNYSLTINNLCEEIDSALCKLKIKTDLLVVMLKKKVQGKNWPFVTENEKRLQDHKDSKFKPSVGKDEDPSKSLMGLMQKMYEEGDDEMKRTIQKSWHESQEKQSSGLF